MTKKFVTGFTIKMLTRFKLLSWGLELKKIFIIQNTQYYKCIHFLQISCIDSQSQLLYSCMNSIDLIEEIRLDNLLNVCLFVLILWIVQDNHKIYTINIKKYIHVNTCGKSKYCFKNKLILWFKFFVDIHDINILLSFEYSFEMGTF